MKITTHSEAETKKLAITLAKNLQGGEIIGLIGNLGAGKTVFVKGLAQGLSIKKKITSPTFVVMKVYPVRYKKIKKFVHVDAYRIKNAQSLTAIGLEDYIKAKDAVVVIEWADLVKKLLPRKNILVKFSLQSKKERILTLVNV